MNPSVGEGWHRDHPRGVVVFGSQDLCRVCLVLLILSVSACSEAPTTPQGETAPTLVDLQVQLFTPSCSFTSCHGGANPKRDLDLSSVEASMAALVGVAGSVPGSVRVVPGDPGASLLVQVLEGAVADVRQMPPDFPMEGALIEGVREWVLTGAIRGEGEGKVPIPGDTGEPPLPMDGPTPEDLAVPPVTEGFQMGIDTVAPAGQEIWKCMVQDLPSEDAFVAVNRVEALQTTGVHHMDVMALGLLGLPIEPGVYECDDLYSTYPEMMEEGIFLFATQNSHETLTLPEGVAAFVPGNLRIMVEIHYVNPTSRDVPVWSRVNAYTIPTDSVQDQIWGSAVRDVDINVPPNARGHVEWLRCEMNQDVDVILLSSHTHQLAGLTEIYAHDGVERGALLYTNDDWHAPQLQQYEPAIHVAAGQGFELHCFYNNPTGEEVNWGFGADDEMCQFALVHTPFAINAECEIVESGVYQIQE